MSCSGGLAERDSARSRSDATSARGTVDDGRVSRGRLLIVAGVTALVAVSLVVLTSLIRSGHDATPRPGWILVGAVDDVRNDHVVFSPGAHSYVVALDHRFEALIAKSPQMGEAVRYCRSSGWFQDPAHGSVFDGEGRYVLGPAPRGLDRLAVHIVGDDVWIDTTNVLLGPPRGPHDARAAGPFCWRTD
jgi:hypothetical protein